MIYVQVPVKAAPGMGFSLLRDEVGEYLRLMQKEGARAVGSFVVRVGEGSGDHVHLFAYPDMAAYADAVDKMGSDPEWKEYLARVAPQVESTDLTILRPVPESNLQ